jgi:fructose/tagatose bisphosphate aldolase
MVATGIDYLACGIGNIHGQYPENWKGLAIPVATICLHSSISANSPVPMIPSSSPPIEPTSHSALECIEVGYTSIMFDGSHLPFEENLKLAKDVVEKPHAK